MNWKRRVEKEILKAYVMSQVDSRYKKVFFTFMVIYLLIGLADAQTQTQTQTLDNSFGALLNLITGWITGNLGKTVAFVGMVISAITFLFMRNWSILIYGIIGSLILGGIVGITKGSFSTGASTFGNSW